METFIKWFILTLLVIFPFYRIMRFSVKQYNIVKPRRKIIFIIFYISVIIGLAMFLHEVNMFLHVITIGFVSLFCIFSYLFVPKEVFQKIFKTEPSRLLYKDLKFWLVVTVLLLMALYRLIWSKIYIRSLVVLVLVIAFLLINNYIRFKKRDKN